MNPPLPIDSWAPSLHARARASNSTRARAGVGARSRVALAWTVAVASAVFAAVAWTPAAQAGPPAGTAIDNVAWANGVDSLSGASLDIGSNAVRTIVQPLAGLALTRSHSDTTAAGAMATLRHRLTNLGNVATVFRLDVADRIGDDFDFATLALVHDVDRDGVAGAGDPGVPSGGTLALAAGDSADLLVLAEVPGSAPAAGIGRLDLTASDGAGLVATNVDTVVVDGVPPPGLALFVEQTVSRAFVEIGDELDYAIRVANRSGAALAGVTLADVLPEGFAYVPRSASRDGAAITDPGGGRGPSLVFPIGTLAPNSLVTFRVRTRVGPGALDGDAINRSWASAGPTDGSVTSNVATTRVTVGGSLFTDEGTIVGTVYIDRDNDRRRGIGDAGLPGVRIYLDDGTFAVTDGDGQYSLYGVTPRTHALRPDPATLPVEVRMIAIEHRQGEGATARFVDLHRGELQRADFAVVPRSPSPAPRDSAAADSAAIAIVRARLLAHRTAPDELPRGIRRELAPTDRPAVGEDRRARPAAGFVENEGLVAGEGGAPDPVHSGSSASGVASGRPAAGVPVPPTLEDALRATEPSLGFLGLADGDTVSVRQIALRVKGPRSSTPELVVNGVVVPPSRIGHRVADSNRDVAASEFVGVSLVPGANRLELAPLPGHTAVVSITIYAPGALARLELAGAEMWPVASDDAVIVRIRALDTRGLPITERTRVTLEATHGRWRSADLDPAAPGFQVVVDGAGTEVELTPPNEPASAELRATAEDPTVAPGTLIVRFLPELRPLFLVGTAEGTLSWRDLRHGGTRPRPATGFEQPMNAFASRFDADRGEAAARAALFLKGRIADGMLLTVGLDSERPVGLRRMRDIQPDAYYPVYGDGGLRGYEAQSTGRLYARLDAYGGSLLYGDFLTQGAGGARSLSAYSRSLSGIQQRFESRRVRVEGFGSRERGARRVDELPGRGVSGPYELRSAPMVENSEVVEIVTRDRHQPSLVLHVEPRARFLDYALDPFTSRLVFKSPVPSFDQELNPVSIRVGYAVEGGGPAYWIAGGEARVQPIPGVEIGGSYVDDQNLERSYALRSGFAAVRLGAATVLEGEYAASETGGIVAGDGGRVELRHESGRARVDCSGRSPMRRS